MHSGPSRQWENTTLSLAGLLLVQDTPMDFTSVFVIMSTFRGNIGDRRTQLEGAVAKLAVF